MRSFSRFSFVLAVAIAVVLTACESFKPDYSKQISTVDSLLNEVKSAELRFQEVDHQTVLNALDTIREDMYRMEFITQGEIELDEARLFADYNSAKRLIKDYPSRFKRISREMTRTQKQLSDFGEMLSQGADLDNQGNKITQEYVNKNLEVEKRIAEELIGQVDETIDYADRAMKSFEELLPQVKAQFKEWKEEKEE